jgi:hypothetical protein
MKKFSTRSIFLTIMAGLGLILQPCHMVAVTAGPTANAPQLSEEDLKFLEDLGNQIKREVEQLPTRAQLRAQGLPEDQVLKANTKEKFDEDVARYSQMSEQELFEEMEKALAEVEKASTPEARPEYPSADIYQGEGESKPVAPVVQKPIVPSNKQQAAVQLIDALLASITNFLSKAQVMVELPGKISSWTKEGKLRNWPATLNWNNFRAQVEDLQAKLNKIKDKDTKLGTYKYLDDLIKDEGTYNNLVKIKDSLAKSEPKIQLGSFAIDKMTTASRQAIRDTLMSLHEAVATLAIPASLDKIIEKYEPTAKKLKESEDAAAKRALEESRRGRTPGYTTVGGYPKADYNGRGRYDFDRDGGGRYSPGLFDAPEREKARPDEKKDAKSSSAGGGAAGGGKADAKKPEDKKAAPEKPKREEDKRADELAKDFSSAAFQIIDALESHTYLAKIEPHMNDKNFVDEDLYKDGIPQVFEGVNKALRATKLLKRQLGRKTLNDDQKKEFKKEIRDGYNKDIKVNLEKLSKQLESVSRAGANVLVPGAASQNELFTQAKTFAYFGKKNETAFKAKIDADKKRVTDAIATATAAATPVPADIVKLDADLKLVEPLLANKDLADLSKLNNKIKELQKAVNDL